MGGSITVGQGARHDQTWAVMFAHWLNLALPPNGSAWAVKEDRRHARRRALLQHGAASAGGGSTSAGALLRQGAAEGERGARQRLKPGAGAAVSRRGLLADAVTEQDAWRKHVEGGPRKGPRHAYSNGAVPGIVSSYMSSCMQHHLPPNPDLVFLEYAANDTPSPTKEWEDFQRRAFERLVRKVLRLPSQPAVVLVHMWAHGAAEGKFWRNAERDFSEVAKYYGLPSVSLKSAVVPTLLRGDKPQMGVDVLFNGGVHHPGQGGHVVVAELLITLALDLLHANHRLAAAMRHSASRFSNKRSVQAAVGGGGGAARAVALLQEAAALELPPPMASGNYEAEHSTCFVGDHLKDLVAEAPKGWNWTDEGRGKWGWVALEKSKDLRIKLSTEVPVAPGEKRSKDAAIMLQVSYLQSYQGMGVAEVSCESGCTCKRTAVDAYSPERKVSVTVMLDLQVTQHANCVLRFRSLGTGKSVKGTKKPPSWASRGTKWKLMGIVVGEDPEASQGSVTWMRADTLSGGSS